MASLLAELTQSGSRLSDGSANDSGTVYAYLPNTTTPASLYTDRDLTSIATQPIVLDDGGRINRSSYPDGLWVTQQVRLLVQDSSGAIVSDSIYTPADAGNTFVDNDGFSDSTLDAVLTDAFTSFGGQDFLYKESGGATSRTVKAKFSEIWISVKDFGAAGDGNATDTQAIQAAVDRVKALGGGTVYFPPGNYKINAAIVATSATALRLYAPGVDSVAIFSTHATANAFTFTDCTGLIVENIGITHSTSSTGANIVLANCTRPSIIGCSLDDTYAFGLDCSATTTFLRVTGTTAAGSTTAIRLAGVTSSFITDCSLFAASGTGVEYKSTSGNAIIANTYFNSTITTGVSWALGLTGTKFVIHGCPTLGGVTTPFGIGISTIPVFRQWGNGVDASATSGNTGAAQTPVLYLGDEVILSATGGGAGAVTVNAPAILPGTTAADVNLYWDFVFVNAAGGAVTWTLNAVFVVSAAVPTTAAHTIGVRFRWDRATSKLREVSRADTVT